MYGKFNNQKYIDAIQNRMNKVKDKFNELGYIVIKNNDNWLG